MVKIYPRPRDVAPLLFSMLTAALAAWLFYVARAGAIVRRVEPAARFTDERMFAAYCLGLLLVLALGAGLALVLVAAVSGRAARLLGPVVAGVAVACVFIDDRLNELYGLHLWGRAVTSLLGAEGVNDVIHLTAGELALIAVIILAAVAGMFLVTNVWSRRLSRSAPSRPWALVGGVAAAALLTAGAAWLVARPALAPDGRLAAVLPLYEPLFGGAIRVEPLAIHYPKTAGARPKMQRRPNIVVVLVESLRSDMFTPDMMPELSRFAHDQGCDHSAHHYSASHVTDFSFFSLVYGLHAYHYLPFAQQHVPSYPLQLLRDNGYAVVGAASSRLKAWGDLGDLTRQFDSFAEFPGSDPAERDRQMADWAAAWRRAHGAERPYFMLLFFDATHHKYFYPPAFERFRPALPLDHSIVTGKVQDPDVRRAFINRYKNSVGYADHLIAQLLGGFASAAKDDLVLVVTGDHGEEFWDNGLLGHTAVSFVNARTQVPLLLCTPEHEARTIERSSHVDIMPTLLDYARLSPPLPAAAYSDGTSLLGAPDPERFLLISGMGFPFTNRQVCLLSRTHKYWLVKERTGAKRFVMTRTTDLDDRDVPPIGDELTRGLDQLERTYRTFFTP